MKKLLTLLVVSISLSATAAEDLNGPLEYFANIGVENKVDDKTLIACDRDQSKIETNEKERLPRSPAVTERFGRFKGQEKITISP